MENALEKYIILFKEWLYQLSSDYYENKFNNISDDNVYEDIFMEFVSTLPRIRLMWSRVFNVNKAGLIRLIDKAKTLVLDDTDNYTLNENVKLLVESFFDNIENPNETKYSIGNTVDKITYKLDNTLPIREVMEDIIWNNEKYLANNTHHVSELLDTNGELIIPDEVNKSQELHVICNTIFDYRIMLKFLFNCTKKYSNPGRGDIIFSDNFKYEFGNIKVVYDIHGIAPAPYITVNSDIQSIAKKIKNDYGVMNIRIKDKINDNIQYLKLAIKEDSEFKNSWVLNKYITLDNGIVIYEIINSINEIPEKTMDDLCLRYCKRLYKITYKYIIKFTGNYAYEDYI